MEQLKVKIAGEIALSADPGNAGRLFFPKTTQSKALRGPANAEAFAREMRPAEKKGFCARIGRVN